MSSGSSSVSQSPSKCGRPAEQKYISGAGTKAPLGARAATVTPLAKFTSPKVPLFHQAGCGERPRNDAADVDAATSRSQRLGAVVANRR